MKQIFYIFLLAGFISTANAQVEPGNKSTVDTSWKSIWRESAPRINDVVHTRLEVSFDYEKSYLYGKEWLTLHPYFYSTDSVNLDAKGMDIKEVALVKGTKKVPLKYHYDGTILRITLDKTYQAQENYTLYFDYVSKPNELDVKGSAAITDAKGLYFINPKGEDKNKPTQIWTQGETESNSAWMITIDKPNQKSTEEIYMTVPDKYVTLSNGVLKSQKKNTDGTRTDYWKMDLPHAPYLFFMGVGDYAIVKDSYKGKEVSYYVEKKYEPVARKIFGHTPEMIKFYSEKLNLDFPWPKYSQIVGRDYVSGAMENTTATLHQESAYQDARQLTDGNKWESVIAHELFHQWFGDLVTTESWSNITVNESFANYGEYLWNEYKYGKDKADEGRLNEMEGYLQSGSDNKDLVRYHYADKEQMFDAVSYNKGGAILHMLRNYLGDDAFFKGLNLYLTSNKFKTGEAAQLRLALEDASGKDLSWFFYQWYYGSGHPKLQIDYDYTQPGVAKVIISQTQKSGNVFILPIAIDVFTGQNATRYNVWMNHAVDSFYFPVTTKPDFINIDADKILLAEFDDHKTEANVIAQYKYAKNYVDRLDALEFFKSKNMPELAKGLYDKYAPLRALTINLIGNTPYKTDKVVIERVEELLNKDVDKKVIAAAIEFLGNTNDSKYLQLFEKMYTDSSYSVAGAALDAISQLDKEKALNLARKTGFEAKGTLAQIASKLIMENGNEADYDLIANAYSEAPVSFEKFRATAQFVTYLTKLQDISKIKNGINRIIDFRNGFPASFRKHTDPSFKNMLNKLGKAKGQEIEDYINSQFK